MNFGVCEADPVCVEVVSAVSWQGYIFTFGGDDGVASGPVERIAHKGVVGCCEVDADLVGAAGDEIDVEQGATVGLVSVQDAADGAGRPAVGHGGVEGADLRVGNFADGRFNNKPVRHVGAGGKRPVDLPDSAVVKVPGKSPLCQTRAYKEDNAGRASAQAVDGRRFISIAFPYERQQGILKMVPARQDREARRFGHHEEVGVFIEEGECAGNIGLSPGRPVIGEPLAGDENRLGRGGLTVQANNAGFNTFLPGRPR